jgi:hypothetical protein
MVPVHSMALSLGGNFLLLLGSDLLTVPETLSTMVPELVEPKVEMMTSSAKWVPATVDAQNVAMGKRMAEVLVNETAATWAARMVHATARFVRSVDS